MDQENAQNVMAHTNVKDVMAKDSFTHKVKYGNFKRVHNVEELVHVRLVTFQDEDHRLVVYPQVYIPSKTY